MNTGTQPTITRPGVSSHLLPTSRKRRVPTWAKSVPFIVLHLACLGVLFTGAPVAALCLCAFTYFIRMFGITAVYHRYFAHPPYKTSRPVPVLLASAGRSAPRKVP